MNTTLTSTLVYRSVILVIIVAALAACSKPTPKDGYTDTRTEGIIPAAIDESLQPIIEQEIAVFENRNVEAEIQPIYCDEARAIDLLLKDSVRVVVTTRMLSAQEQQQFDDKQWSVTQEVIATDALALIINNSNSDSVISVGALRKILTGEVTQWKQLYPSSTLGEIALAFDHTHSGTVRYARDSICNGQPFATKGIYAQKNNKAVFDYVSKTPNAIGVIGVCWLDNSADTTNMSFKAGVRVMKVCPYDEINPVIAYKPYQAYIALKHYPLTRDVYALCSDPRQALSSNFAHFLTDDIGQRVILKSGIVPKWVTLRLVQINDGQ